MSEIANNNDITIVYYTANKIGHSFAESTRKILLEASHGFPIVSVSQQKIDFGHNICVGDIGQNTLNIYRQALIGAKEAKTEYIGLAEDDVLYSPDHFMCYRPDPGVFAYNMNMWVIYTWTRPPIFSYKGRRNLYALICHREDFIRTMEERFAKYPDGTGFHAGHWGEPGKYERSLGVQVNPTEEFHSEISGIAFSHDKAVSFQGLGTRKAHGSERRDFLPYWGAASAILQLYV